VPQASIPIWKRAPFVRLIIPLITGIFLQWYLQTGVSTLIILFIVSLASHILFFFLPIFRRFSLLPVNGVFLFILFFSTGALLEWNKDIRNQPAWFGQVWNQGDGLIVTLLEDPVEKARSFRVLASADYILKKDKIVSVKGHIILYFRKDSTQTIPGYGKRFLTRKTIQGIGNTGNPGAFDYKRYSLFRGITHQVYLDESGYEILPGLRSKPAEQMIRSLRKQVLSILRKYIKGNRELGLAEALLIGYKDDLDKTLTRSYSNTGVVHVIAISGLHLGLIYWLLTLLFRPFQKYGRLKRFRPFFILSGLWLFCFLAGAHPSVVRAAVMFTCLVTADSIDRRASVFNSLALSAFILLCINPYWLWEAGFQLSYAALTGILLFSRPVSNWFYFKNRFLSYIWKLNAVTLAAQVFTIPVSIYHFHQFPNYFLFTNIIAVPLASLVLMGEIFLCLVSFIPFIAEFTGEVIVKMIRVLNGYIAGVEKLPYSLSEGIQISFTQSILLMVIAAGLGFWLLEKKTAGFRIALVSSLMMLSVRVHSHTITGKQSGLIVYNMPRKKAIDFIQGRKFFFVGNLSDPEDSVAADFYLKPSRNLLRIKEAGQLPGLTVSGNCLDFAGKKILILDQSAPFFNPVKRISLDLLIVSGSPDLDIKTIAGSVEIGQVVFDGTVPYNLINRWKRDSDQFGIPWHDVRQHGAFVMRLR